MTGAMSRLDRRTAVVLAVLMPLGPLCIAALRGLLPTFSSDKAVDVAAAVAGAPARQSAVVWLGYVALLTLVPGVLAGAGRRGAAAHLVGHGPAGAGLPVARRPGRAGRDAVVRPRRRAGPAVGRESLRPHPSGAHCGDSRVRGGARRRHGAARAGTAALGAGAHGVRVGVDGFAAAALRGFRGAR